MDRASRKHYYNLCNPNEALGPEDPRNLDIDALVGDVRGGSFARSLASRIELSTQPVCELCTAIPGAGLSTELRRLTAILDESEGAHQLTVHVEAEEVLDLWSPIELVDVFLVMLERSERGIAAAENKPLPEPLRRIRAWLTSADPILRARWLPTEGPSHHIRGSAETRKLIRACAQAEFSRFVSEIRDELTLLNHRARQLGYEGLTVLFDGLTKLRGMSTTFDEVVTSAERLFEADASYLELPVHVVYSLPPALLLRLSKVPRVLPMIALTQRSGAPNEAGRAAARALLAQRLPEEAQDALFGASKRAQRVERVLAASGGSPREIVRLIQLLIASPPSDDGQLSRELAMAHEHYIRAISEEALDWLLRVHTSQSISFSDAAERKSAELMIANGLVLPYQDQSTWFGLHPALRRHPVLAGKI